MREVIIDTNIFVLLLAGQINPDRIAQYCRNELYKREDYDFLVSLISNFDRIITCPNILTEVDNLLNGISGEDKNTYLLLSKKIFRASIEKYLKSDIVADNWYFNNLGLTDSAILMMADALTS